jgi:translocation and assembly module TamB
LLLAILLGAFGVLQTRAGQAWLAETVAQTVSSPDFAVSVEGLHGIVPFHLTIDRIDVADRDGTYLTLRDFGLDISAAASLARQLKIRSLRFAEIEMAR